MLGRRRYVHLFYCMSGMLVELHRDIDCESTVTLHGTSRNEI